MRRKGSFLEQVVAILGHRHPASVSQIALSSLIAATTEYGWITAAYCRLEVAGFIDLVDAA